ncbi:hypothetical protein IVB38_34575 [Bradyrhizobium sp. 38]|uniref:hypothetical protein n=1 Tax=unclassified Bradyrhizobium TaxID=2631580 RepID=UPI001FF9E978|nr:MULTISPECIES: hypothetical protein [unclassified Bradyrhizobium]MCK1341006.1 hypothetical protein [Bradyrhizobium sp. 38]MCK1780985.1 hypothetical protein [Bradyrhizobium sp. 132]
MAADLYRLFPIRDLVGTSTITVGADTYTIEQLDRGYGRVTTENGELVMLYPLSMIRDRELVRRMIVTWRDGFERGMREGLARGRDERNSA